MDAISIQSTNSIDILPLAEDGHGLLAPDLEMEFGERHVVDTEHILMNTSPAADLLKSQLTYSIREGIAAYVEWYRDNVDWYGPLVRAS